MVIVILIIFGLCLGSFVNALIYRLHAQSTLNSKGNPADLSIMSGRSICPSCYQRLAVRDLVPIFSWISLKGRCRYCKKAISWQYPAVELATVVIFVFSYLFWPSDLHVQGNLILFCGWILTSVGLLSLLIYDFRWMLLPSKIIYPTLAIAATSRLIYLVGYEQNHWQALLKWVLSVAVASGLFWLIFMGSKGAWIGYGDVRLGLITGTVLADPLMSFLMIFVASLLGLVFMMPIIFLGRKKLTSRIPYGPFLITATILTLLFGQSVIDWYKRLLII